MKWFPRKIRFFTKSFSKVDAPWRCNIPFPLQSWGEWGSWSHPIIQIATSSVLQEHTRSTHTRHTIRQVVSKTHTEWLTSRVCKEGPRKTNLSKPSHRNAQLQTRSQKRNLIHSQSAPLSHRPSQHSQSDTARHNSSHKIFINRIPILAVAPSQTQPATFNEKNRIRNHSKDRYTSAVLGHGPLRLAPRRVLFSHTHPSLMRL